MRGGLDQARAPQPELPAAALQPRSPVDTTVVSAVKVAFGPTAWPLTIGGSRAGQSLTPPPPGSHLPSSGPHGWEAGLAVSPHCSGHRATRPLWCPPAQALGPQALYLVCPLAPPGCPAQDGRRQLLGTPLLSHSQPHVLKGDRGTGILGYYGHWLGGGAKAHLPRWSFAL